ncbi:hypothetical protein JCM5296_000894 [Sporobolomyces johnsonii]
MLVPGSALTNYFGLDLSFLDDEPPPRTTSAWGSARRASASVSQKGRPVSGLSERSAGSSAEKSEDVYFTVRTVASMLPRSPTRSLYTGAPFPPSDLPFPSRPASVRRSPAESVSSRHFPVFPADSVRHYPPDPLSSSFSDDHRPSMSSLGSGSSGPSLTSQSQPGRKVGTDFAEKRKRLAAFLDETASAMEGGKTLVMVLPEAGTNEQETSRSLSELADQHNASPCPPSRRSSHVEYRHPFEGVSDEVAPPHVDQQSHISDSTLSLDLASTPISTRPSRESAGPETDRRQTVYFSPKPGDDSSEDVSPDEDENQAIPCTGALRDDSPGLGFANVEIKSQSTLGNAVSHQKRLPSTVHADLPAPSEAAKSLEQAREAEKRVKTAEKRRRTIRELVETETTYAIDMAVVRDIYLARARGAHMVHIADHVMSSGLGLGGVGFANALSPQPDASRLERNASTSRVDQRPSFQQHDGDICPASAASHGHRRPTTLPTLPNLIPGQPLMSAQDIHTVFANLEEIATLAEAFAGLLDGAMGSETGDDKTDDRIGDVFVEMIPRVQQVYSTYCARHHRAIVRLQELEPTLRTYFFECKTLSHGRTTAWDLASLLIKPVQRCLKYPLLLDQILAMTPNDHPDRASLQRANTDMLMVAEHINEYKKRNDAVARIVAKDKVTKRRDSSKSISSMSTTVTKKLLRSSQKAKTALGFAEIGGDEMFDTLVALVESTRSGASSFSREMRKWTKSTKNALEAQVTMVEGWIELYAPMAGEHHVTGSGYHRLCVFLDEVLIPIIDGPWRELDHEVHQSLILKTDHLLSLFENPRQVIAKRNDKMLDHHRYLARKLPSDRKGSEDFLVLSAQLLEELPRFLGSVSRYFNIIVGHFAGAQAAYHESVQARWAAFMEQWLVRSPGGSSYEDIQAMHTSQLHPFAQLMDTLAAGLSINVSRETSSPANCKRTSRPLPLASTSSPSSSAPSRLSLSRGPSGDDRSHPNRQSSQSTTTTDYSSDRQINRGSLSSTHRSSVTSDSSSPSTGEPTSVQEKSTVTAYDLNSGVPRPRSVDGRAGVTEQDKFVSAYSFSFYTSVEEGCADEDEEVPENDAPLYIAEAMNASCSTAYRSGYPILSFAVGDRLRVELEEADRAEGGSGWLLGRKVGGEGRLGWARTEDFVMVSDEEAE